MQDKMYSLVIGSVGKKKRLYTISRAIFSRAEASPIREKGFLGSAWITDITSDNWSNVIAKPINIVNPTIDLGNLFFVFNGVTHNKEYPPVSTCPEGELCKPTWRMRWRRRGSLWADPQRVDKTERWVRYDPKVLHRAALDLAHLFDLPKILVGRIANRASKSALPVQLDTTGFCPNNSIWCILPVREAQRFNRGYSLDQKPESWDRLSFEEQKLWLLGILASEFGTELSMSGRGTINLTKNVLCQLPLPSVIDNRIIQVVNRIIEKEQHRVQSSDELHQELNDLVIESYGYPSHKSIQRTGVSPGLEEWQLEQKRKALTVIGQVLKLSQDKEQVLLRLSGLLDDNEEEWLMLPSELPGWALDGTVFEAELSEDIETFQELAQRPWALRKFRHTPYPYLTNDNLKAKLGRIIGLENY